MATHSCVDKKVLLRYSERLLDSNLSGLSGRDVAIILNALVRLSHPDRRVFGKAGCFLRSLPVTEFIGERDLGLIFNAYARAGVLDEDLFQSLNGRVLVQLSVLSPKTSGNICHALGKLKSTSEPSRDLIIKIAEHVSTNVGNRVSPPELSNVLYSLGNLGIRDLPVIDPLLKLVCSKIHWFNPIEMSAVATALCKLSITDRSLLKALAKQVQTKADYFDAYEIVAILHAYSQLDIKAPRGIFLEVAPKILMSKDMNSHTASIAYCAYSRVGLALPAELLVRLGGMISTENDPQYLVNVLFAYSKGTSGAASTPILETIVTKLLKRPFPVNPINLNQLLYGINRLTFSEWENPLVVELYRKVVLESLRAVADFTPTQLSNILFAISHRLPLTLTEHEIQLVKRVVNSTDFLSSLSPQLLSSVQESVTMLGMGSDSFRLEIQSQLEATLWDTAKTPARDH